MAPIPAYASAIIILFSVMLPAVCWLGVHSAALPADWRLVSGVTGLFLGAWVLAALALCIAGEFHPGAAKLIPGRSNSAPFLGSALAIALILFLAVAPFRRTLDDVANSWLVAAQVGRVMGFLVTHVTSIPEPSASRFSDPEGRTWPPPPSASAGIVGCPPRPARRTHRRARRRPCPFRQDRNAQDALHGPPAPRIHDVGISHTIGVEELLGGPGNRERAILQRHRQCRPSRVERILDPHIPGAAAGRRADTVDRAAPGTDEGGCHATVPQQRRPRDRRRTPLRCLRGRARRQVDRIEWFSRRIQDDVCRSHMPPRRGEIRLRWNVPFAVEDPHAFISGPTVTSNAPPESRV